MPTLIIHQVSLEKANCDSNADWLSDLKGYSSELHCTSLLCMIFASLARTHKRMHIQNGDSF